MVRKINLYEETHIVKQQKNIGRKIDSIEKNFFFCFRSPILFILNEILWHGTHLSYLAKNI